MSEISSGTTDTIVHDIESIDFDQNDIDIDELIKKIQKDIEIIQTELQFCRNLKGKIMILFALSLSIIYRRVLSLRTIRSECGRLGCLMPILDRLWSFE